MARLDNAAYLAQLATPGLASPRAFEGLPAAATAGTATLDVPPGPTLQGMLLHLEDAAGDRTLAEMKADIDTITLKVDGEVKFQITGTQAVLLADLYVSGSVANGNLPIYFGRPWMELIGNQDGPAWGLRGLGTVSIEVKVTGAHGVTAIKGYLITTGGELLGDHITTRRITRPFSSTGNDHFTGFPLDQVGKRELYAIHIHKASYDIDDLTLRVNGSEIFKGPVDELHHLYLPYGITPQSDLVSIIPTFRGRDIDALPLNPETMELIINWGTAPTSYDIIMEIAERELTRAQRLERARAA